MVTIEAASLRSHDVLDVFQWIAHTCSLAWPNSKIATTSNLLFLQGIFLYLETEYSFDNLTKSPSCRIACPSWLHEAARSFSLNCYLFLSASRRVFSSGVSTRIALIFLKELFELKTRLLVLRKRLQFKQWPNKNPENRVFLSFSSLLILLEVHVRIHTVAKRTAWCSEIGSLMSLGACNSGASSHVRELISLHQAVCNDVKTRLARVVHVAVELFNALAIVLEEVLKWKAGRSACLLWSLFFRKFALVGIIPDQILTFFSDNDRRADSWIRRKKSVRKTLVRIPAGLCCVFFFFCVWSSCQFFYHCRRRRREFG